MIRITGGQYRGRQILSPKSDNVRPTTGRVRESLFSQLQPWLTGARFMDCFAGSGLMGLEALSRGASFVLAVEQDSATLRLIRRNYQELDISLEHYKLLGTPVEKLIARPCREQPFDIIYLDPPYGTVELQPLVDNLKVHDWLAPNGWIIVEHGDRDSALEEATRKIYGETALSFIRPSSPDSGSAH